MIRFTLILFCLSALGVASAPAAPVGSSAVGESESKKIGWEGLTRSLTPTQAAATLEPKFGPPLMVTHSKDRRFETWNYDRGGYLLFIGGRLDSWSASRPEQPGRADVNPSTDVRRETN